MCVIPADVERHRIELQIAQWLPPSPSIVITNQSSSDIQICHMPVGAKFLGALHAAAGGHKTIVASATLINKPISTSAVQKKLQYVVIT